MSDTVESLIAYCKENGRVCPLPMHWHRLWEMLPNRTFLGVGWEPSLPLILGGWSSPDLAKMLRLAEHIEWAEKHGALDDVAAFLRGLCEDDWHHVDRGRET